jgi:hypothetical protein
VLSESLVRVSPQAPADDAAENDDDAKSTDSRSSDKRKRSVEAKEKAEEAVVESGDGEEKPAKSKRIGNQLFDRETVRRRRSAMFFVILLLQLTVSEACAKALPCSQKDCGTLDEGHA